MKDGRRCSLEQVGGRAGEERTASLMPTDRDWDILFDRCGDHGVATCLQCHTGQQVSDVGLAPFTKLDQRHYVTGCCGSFIADQLERHMTTCPNFR